MVVATSQCSRCNSTALEQAAGFGLASVAALLTAGMDCALHICPLGLPLHNCSALQSYACCTSGPPTQRRFSSSSSSSSRPLPVQAIHILLCCYVAVWLLTALPLSSSGPLVPLKLLSLDQLSSSSSGPFARGLCLLTDALLSPSSTLLARNLFFGYMFGRVVENTESSSTLWLTFALSALGALGESTREGEHEGVWVNAVQRASGSFQQLYSRQ